MPINPPAQLEIASLSAFSHRWLVQAHIDNERNAEAVLAYHYPPAIFAVYDQQIEAAFLLGYLMGLAD